MRHGDEVVGLTKLVVLGSEAVDERSSFSVIHTQHVAGLINRGHHHVQPVHGDGARHEGSTLKLKLKQYFSLKDRMLIVNFIFFTY